MANSLSDQWRALLYSDHRPPLAFTNLGVFAHSCVRYPPQLIPAGWGVFARCDDLFQSPSEHPHNRAHILNPLEYQSVLPLPQISNRSESERVHVIPRATEHTRPGGLPSQSKNTDRAKDPRYRERVPLRDREKRTMAPGVSRILQSLHSLLPLGICDINV